jgi:hypothetical protein
VGARRKEHQDILNTLWKYDKSEIYKLVPAIPGQRPLYSVFQSQMSPLEVASVNKRRNSASEKENIVIKRNSPPDMGKVVLIYN